MGPGSSHVLYIPQTSKSGWEVGLLSIRVSISPVLAQILPLNIQHPLSLLPLVSLCPLPALHGHTTLSFISGKPSGSEFQPSHVLGEVPLRCFQTGPLPVGFWPQAPWGFRPGLYLSTLRLRSVKPQPSDHPPYVTVSQACSAILGSIPWELGWSRSLEESVTAVV